MRQATTVKHLGYIGRLFFASGGSLLPILLIFVLLLAPIKTLGFGLPRLSAGYDCDDDALAMLDRLTTLGIQAVPMVGNLDMTGEAYLELNHVWIVAEIAGIRLAFDLGAPRLDWQHYEGYPITRAKLLEFVANDFQRNRPD